MASFVLPIISGLAGLFGGAPKTTTTNQSGTSSQNTQGTQSFNSANQSATSPIATQLQQLLASVAGNKAVSDITNNPFDTGAYQAQGLENINQGADAQRKLTQSILASRGLSYSPYSAYASILPEQSRIAQSSQFLNTVPQAQQAYNTQQLQNVENAQIMPYGTSTTGSNSGFGNTSGNTEGSFNGTSTSTTPNQGLGGLLSGLGAGFGAPSGGAGSPSNLSSIFKALGWG